MRSRLSVACERALVESARALRAGTRQQCRAAARRFVRRHRRDAGYLRWVLCSATASSALALALLGLGAEPAHAKATFFSWPTGAANPLNGQSVGSDSAPALGDLDGDGDLDLVASMASGELAYLENTGSATSPAFAARTGAQNPLDGLDAGTYATPALGDLDADGDLELVAGEIDGTFTWFENTGSATSPAFALRTGAQNPLDGQDVGLYAAPAFGDLDGDGDLDLASGASSAGSVFAWFENTGSAASPALIRRTGAENPLHDADFARGPAPSLGDLDGDGDLDLVAGDYYGAFRFRENTGSATSPAFVTRTGAQNPLAGGSAEIYSKPALGDLDADGDLDLVSGSYDGSFFYFENQGGTLVRRTGLANPLFPLDAGYYSKPALGDLDGDGDLDLVAGQRYPLTVLYFENTGSAAGLAFAARTGAANPFDGVALPQGRSAPALGDLDGDGDLDAIAGWRPGSFVYLENTGAAGSPAFIQRTGAANPLDGQDVGSDSTPALGDLDADGDLDLVAGESLGDFFYFENTGSAASPVFVPRTGAANPLDGLDVGFDATPSLGDLDGDGDLDLVAGEYAGDFFYFENTGGAANAAFAARTGTANPGGGESVGGRSAPSLGDLDADGDLDLVSGELYGGFRFFENAIVKPSLSAFELVGGANPLNGQDAGSFSRPTLADLDGDGDLDLVAGASGGTFAWFENTKSVTSPAFVARTGAQNPLDGQDVGSYAAPAFGDLDGDGDLDLVAGEELASFSYFENTGDATSPAFAPRTGAANPFDGLLGTSDAPAPALADVDGDGDLDLVAGDAGTGTFAYFENTGDAASPSFVARTGAVNPLEGLDAGDASAPALGDFDGDGDLDLLSGTYDGTFAWFENTGSATIPSLVARTGSANPLDGLDVGAHSAPALGDLDGDGDADLVAGNQGGGFRTFYLPEPGHGALLGAGIALLSWLARSRKREEG